MWQCDNRPRPERLRNQQARLGRAEGLAQWCQDWLNHLYDRAIWRHYRTTDADGCTRFLRTLAWHRPH